MRKVVVSEFVSLDLVMEAPGGEPGYRHSGWVGKFMDDSQLTYKLDEVLAAEALLLGRKTYEGFAAAWPSREGEFADKMNAMPKYVASTTLELSRELLRHRDILPAEHSPTKEMSTEPVADPHDVIDEYRLMVFPIVLGSGMRLFDETADATTLDLVDTQPPASGTVILTYQPGGR